MLKKVFPSVLLILFTLFFYYIISPPQTNIAVASSNIVNPNQKYTYNEMVRDIKRLAKQYPSIIHYEKIGKSEYGRPIYAVSLGKGKATVFINGSHHAREWLTTNLNMYMCWTNTRMTICRIKFSMGMM